MGDLPRINELNLDEIVVEWCLGDYPPERMPSLATWALEQGFDGPALRNLAGLATATLSNEAKLTEAALRELGKEPLERIEAGRLIVPPACKQILAVAVSPHGGGSRVWSVYDRCGLSQNAAAVLWLRKRMGDGPEHRDHYDPLIVKAAQTFARTVTVLKHRYEDRPLLRITRARA